MRTHKKMWLVAAGMILAAVTVTFAAFFQSFEFNADGWFGATRVSSGTHTVPSESGAFHAEDGGGAFTRWGGYSDMFPAGGYTTTVDIYLDISSPYMNGSLLGYPNDTRFDWTSAVSTPTLRSPAGLRLQRRLLHGRRFDRRRSPLCDQCQQ